MFNIEEELKKLPAKPGVYIMHNDKDEIIYVGKAIKLCNRVRQYFQGSRNLTTKIQHMVSHIAYFEYIITDSELEALVLECNLIKEHRPKYNTMLKDDKNYPYIKVTTNEEYPRIMLARRMKQDKCRYFGPYTSAGAVKDIIELLRKLFKIRTCSRKLPKDIGKDRPCLYYQIKQCEGPCQDYISGEDYRKSIDQVLSFLNGNYKDVSDMLEEKMKQAAADLEFEQAAEYYSEDKDTRANGGIMINSNAESELSGSASFVFEDLPQDISKEIHALKTGEISKPFILRLPNGTEEVVIVKLKEVHEGHRANLNSDYRTIKSLALANKREREIENWIRRKQKETPIRISDSYENCDFRYPGWVKE